MAMTQNGLVRQSPVVKKNRQLALQCEHADPVTASVVAPPLHLVCAVSKPQPLRRYRIDARDDTLLANLDDPPPLVVKVDAPTIQAAREEVRRIFGATDDIWIDDLGPVDREPPEPMLLSRGDIAARCGVSESTVDRWVKAEGLPHIREGRRVLFRPEAVDRWLAAREESV